MRLRISIPIAGGECEYLRHGFKTLLDSKSVDIIQVRIFLSVSTHAWFHQFRFPKLKKKIFFRSLNQSNWNERPSRDLLLSDRSKIGEISKLVSP